MLPHDELSPHGQARWLAIENVGSYTIPPFGVCEVVDSYRPESSLDPTPDGGVTVLKVRRPSSAELCNWVVNWSCQILAGETKIGTKDSPMNALVDSAAYSPGDILGVEKDSFALTEGRCGFVVDGDYDAAYQCLRVTRRDDCPVEMKVRATECSKVGEVATAKPLMWDDSACDWIDDPSKSEINISDPLCQRLAYGDSTSGEKYDVYRPGNYCEGGSCNYIPLRPFGLKRRVKITSEIACGVSGLVSLMENTGAGTGGGDCLWAELTPKCEFYACNNSNRRIACDADEEATVLFMEGECVGWLIPDTRALYAIAEANQNSCPDLTDVPILNIQYKDVCSWTTRTTVDTVNNPAGIYFCDGDTLILKWNDVNCGWDVVNVEDHVDYVVEDMYCEENSCKLIVRSMQVAMHKCCEENSIDTEIPTSELDVLAGVSKHCYTAGGEVTGCGINFAPMRICVLGCKDPAVGTVETIHFEIQEVMVDADFYQNGLQLELKKYYKEVCVLCRDDYANYVIDIVVGQDCATGTGGDLLLEDGGQLTDEAGGTLLLES